MLKCVHADLQIMFQIMANRSPGVCKRIHSFIHSFIHSIHSMTNRGPSVCKQCARLEVNGA